MEFAWNTQKNKLSDIKGLENEQERKGKISNADIDLNRTNLNYDLVKNNLNLYQRIKKRIDEVREVSRIQKNSVVDYSNIITVPEIQSEIWGIDKTKEYFNQVYNYFCSEFGKENIVSAKIHLDETAPHMHLHFVPVNNQNGKLQARKVMTPNRINKIHTEAPKFLNNFGFDVVRGKGSTGKNNIEDIHEYKKIQADKLKKEIDSLKIDLKAHIEAKSSLECFSGIDKEKSILGGKIKLKTDDYYKIVDEYNGLLNLNLDLDKKNKDLEEKNKSLLKKINEINKKDLNFNKNKNRLEFEIQSRYEDKIKKLEKENRNLEKENYDFKSELRLFYIGLDINNDQQREMFFKKAIKKQKNLDYDR